MLQAEKLLNDVFGYKSFRPLQSDIIKHILEKKDTLVIMPTGGGKSLCYQIPALIFDGLTIVISPLISLMKDQVSQLRMLGVEAALLNSSLAPPDYAFNYNLVKNKQAKLLYIAPESLDKERVEPLFRINEVSCIAVDEAHCISAWGHDFRKEYRQISGFRKKFPSAVCIALTATATPKVQDDIAVNLKMQSYQKFIASFNRENLYLEVSPKRDAFGQTLKFLNDHKKQPGIIYCFSRRQVDELSTDLTSSGFSNKPYHAGLSDKERHLNQDLFIKDEVDIIIATIAFGMGINKSNVRFVIHYDLPKNLESYYQEIGRSGRDSVRSDCLLLFSYSDTAKINYFINQKEDEIERLSAKQHLEAMVKYSESGKCRRIPLINYFGESYLKSYCGMCDNCLDTAEHKTDITIPAQKFLSAVKRTGEIYGALYIIDILTGSETEKILRNRHHNLTVYGIGKEFKKKQWQIIARQLIADEHLNKDPEYGSLKLTESATGILKNRTKIFGDIREVKQRKKIISADYDYQLFDILKVKRKQIADKTGVPPYVIFSDKTLLDMTLVYPKTESQFISINGIGTQKLERFGKIFIPIIEKYCIDNKITEKKTKPEAGINLRGRFAEVAKAFNEGESISSLMSLYKVKIDTILAHLVNYSETGEYLRIDGLKEALKLSKDQWQNVFDAFDELGTTPLKPVFDKFNETIPYQDLRILKIFYKKKAKGESIDTF